MQILNKTIKNSLALLFGGVCLALSSGVWAEEVDLLKAREISQHGGMDHSAHAKKEESNVRFRGVFYGFLPCDELECAGTKMTLSLKHNGTYLLIIQPAKPLNRESFEKGKYVWDDNKRTLFMTPNKADAPPRRMEIRDASTLVHLNSDGTKMPGDQDQYLLERSDKANNREVHIH